MRPFQSLPLCDSLGVFLGILVPCGPCPVIPARFQSLYFLQAIRIKVCYPENTSASHSLFLGRNTYPRKCVAQFLPAGKGACTNFYAYNYTSRVSPGSIGHQVPESVRLRNSYRREPKSADLGRACNSILNILSKSVFLKLFCSANDTRFELRVRKTRSLHLRRGCRAEGSNSSHLSLSSTIIPLVRQAVGMQGLPGCKSDSGEHT